MRGCSVRKLSVVFSFGVLFFCSAPLVHATVYFWQGESGVLNLSNDPEEVPEAQRETAQQFTTKLAGKSTSEAAVALAPTTPEETLLNVYERGLERGLQTAEQQVALAGELARSVLSAIPPVPPTRIIIQQSAPTVVRHVSPGYAGYPFYGAIGPYSPYAPYGYGYGYAYGFRRGRFVSHSHFFPGTRGRRTGIFFPRGHFSRDGFLFGHGFVVR